MNEIIMNANTCNENDVNDVCSKRIEIYLNRQKRFRVGRFFLMMMASFCVKNYGQFYNNECINRKKFF